MTPGPLAPFTELPSPTKAIKKALVLAPLDYNNLPVWRPHPRRAARIFRLRPPMLLLENPWPRSDKENDSQDSSSPSNIQ